MRHGWPSRPEAGHGRSRGYATAAERHAKTIRLRSLQARLARVERQLEAGTVSVVRGGRLCCASAATSLLPG